jgi:hypothetical protein
MLQLFIIHHSIFTVSYSLFTDRFLTEKAAPGNRDGFAM